MKYAFIQCHRKLWPISVQCRVLQVSAAGYHEHVVRSASNAQRRHLSDDALLVHIKAIYAQMRDAYGWPRIWRTLSCRRHPGRQAARAKADEAARHQGQRQAPLQGNDRQQSRFADSARPPSFWALPSTQRRRKVCAQARKFQDEILTGCGVVQKSINLSVQ